MPNTKYYVMWTTLSDKTKKDFRETIRPMVDSSFHDAINQGVCDYLYSCTSLEPNDILKAIDESKIK